jgi:peptidoglycan/xylan/chitin deacetylase (PgdA/CDA1 family)
MRHVSDSLVRSAAWVVAAALEVSGPLHAATSPLANPANVTANCNKPVYLTFDTGHMGVAPLIAKVLKQHQVPVTFFAAQEKTQEGDGTLGQHWASWWQDRGAENHDFASHTFDHAYWRADLEGNRFKIRPSAGEQAGKDLNWGVADYCENLKQASQRLEALTGRPSLPLFRAPGGKTSPALIQAAASCGYAHVGWSPAGFLGDELSSKTHSNADLLKNSLKHIQRGDILMAHLGIWSRQEPWAPAVLEPLIVGLKEKGFCFASLRQHPQYAKLLADIPKTQKRP